MKRILKLSAFLIVTFLLIIGTNSCVKETTGTVVIRNNAGYRLKVDVTWGGAPINHERWVNNGSSTTYNRVPEGRVRIWSSATGYDWDWLTDDIFLTAGQTYTHTFYYKSEPVSFEIELK